MTRPTEAGAATSATSRQQVVVTGLGVVSPTGLDVANTWESVVAGRSGIVPISRFEVSEPGYAIAGEIRGFDPQGRLPSRMIRNAAPFTLASLRPLRPPASFLRYVVAGLIAFDMGRLMGPARTRYTQQGFLGQLSTRLASPSLSAYLEQLSGSSIVNPFSPQQLKDIDTAHDALSQGWTKGSNTVHSSVGASKVLHFLNPDVFVMADRYTSKALGGGTYLEKMKAAGDILRNLGVKSSNGVPATRLLDKALFARTAGWC